MQKVLALFMGCSCFLVTNTMAQQIDTTFNTNGYLPYQGPNSNSEENLGSGIASVIQADGKIVTVLKRDSNTSDLFMHIYRYMPDGMPDPTFGTNGAAENFCGQDSRGYDVEIQSDGKIVLVGESKYCINGVCGAKQFIMMRLKTDGSLDSTFGNNGHILTSDVFGTSGMYSIPKSLVILPNGQFMVGGRGPNGKPAIVRLNSDGFPDNSYGTNGVYSFTAVSSSDYVDMAIGSNGEAYGLLQTRMWDPVTLTYDSTNYSDNTLFKLTPNGALDTNFGTNGVFTFGTDNTDSPVTMTLTSTGKLLVAGDNQPENYHYSTLDFEGYGQTNKGYVAFVNTNGTLDMSIPNGFSVFDFLEDSATFFNKIIERNPNEFLIAGYTTDYVGGNFQDKGLVVSMNDQGQLNTGFDGNGYMIFDHGVLGTSGWNGKLADFMDVDLINTGKIILTGYRNPIGGATRGSIYMLCLNYGPVSNLGLEQLSGTANWNCYPNPVTDQHLTIETDEAATVSLYSLEGRLLQQQELASGASEILLENAYHGMVLVQLITASGKTTSRKILFD